MSCVFIPFPPRANEKAEHEAYLMAAVRIAGRHGQLMPEALQGENAWDAQLSRFAPLAARTRGLTLAGFVRNRINLLPANLREEIDWPYVY